MLGISIFLLILSAVLMLFYKREIPASLIEKKYSLPNSSYTEVGDVRVHYAVYGKGSKTLVMLHGSAGSLHEWNKLAKLLEDDYRIVSIDLPGFALSSGFVNGQFTSKQYVDFLKLFLEKLSITKPILVGNSFGSQIAMEYAVANPGAVEQLILCSTTGFKDSEEVNELRDIIRKPIGAFVMKRFATFSIAEHNVKKAYANDELVTGELVVRYYELMLKENNREYFHQFLLTDHFVEDDFYEKVTVPCLLLWGDKDEMISVDLAQKYHNLLPNDSLIIMKNIGSNIMDEAPEEVARLIEKRLDL